MVNGIDLQQIEYNPSEVFIDLEESEHNVEEDKSDNLDNTDSVLTLALQSSAIDLDLLDPDIDLDLDKLCTTCMTSKSMQTVKRHKSMTPTSEKLEEVHANL